MIISLILVVISCSKNTKQAQRGIKAWEKHLFFKDSIVQSILEKGEIGDTTKKVIEQIANLKVKIKSESQSLNDHEIAVNSLLFDYQAYGYVYKGLKKLKFSHSQFADIKYNSFKDGWEVEYFGQPNAIEAFSLLTDIQMDILNYCFSKPKGCG